MKKLTGYDFVALVLVVIGGLNWGLVGLFDFDLAAFIFGETSILARIIYLLVGLSAIYTAVRSPHFAHLQWRRGEKPHAV